MLAFYEKPKPAAVYNLGGGRANTTSILEGAARFEELLGQPFKSEYVDEPRRGDHICYISDLSSHPGGLPGVGHLDLARGNDGADRAHAGHGLKPTFASASGTITDQSKPFEYSSASARRRCHSSAGPSARSIPSASPSAV